MTLDWIDERYEGFDFETSGTLPEYALQPWRVAQGLAWPTSFVSIHRAAGQTVVKGGLNPDRAMLRRILQDAIDGGRRMVGWFVIFDIAWLLALGCEDLVFKLKWLDGMLLWKHATVEPEYDLNRANKKKYTLKGPGGCVEELWPEHAGYEEDIDFHDPDPAVRKKLHNYNIKDVAFTLKGAKYWWNKLTPRQKRVALIEAESFPWVARANLDGIPVDMLEVRELQTSLHHYAEHRRNLLAPLGITDEVATKGKNKGKRTSVAQSPVKLAAVIYDNWGVPTVPGKGRSVDKEVMHELALGLNGLPPDPRVRILSEYRVALNAKAKFADAVAQSVDYNADGCIHPTAMVFSTYTGRMTYSSKQGKNKDTRPIGYALHQEKREKVFRRKLKAPQGYTIVEFDAAGQEFKWMAVASMDEVMLSLCAPGEDAHCFLGAGVAGMDYRTMRDAHKVGDNPVISGPHGFRMMGKVGNLSLQYRTSAARLLVTARVDYKLPLVIGEAEHIHSTYKKSYPDVPRYWKYQIEQTKSKGYVATMAGRRVQVVGDWHSRGWAMGSTAINYRIQGTGADQKYLAIACMQSLATEVGARLGWDLHDGLYWFVPDDKVDTFAARGKKILDNLPYKRAWDLDLPIVMNWDCKTGPIWGMLKDWHG